MKGCVQNEWNPVYDWEGNGLKLRSNLGPLDQQDIASPTEPQGLSGQWEGDNERLYGMEPPFMVDKISVSSRN